MKTVQKIIDLFGGLEQLQHKAIHLEVQGFMPLSIEHIGTGPRGLPLVSVMHYYEQQGDLCRDPDMEFEIDETGKWHPISYRQDSVGMMQQAVYRDPDTHGLVTHRKLVRDLERFSRTWSRNLKEQGFLDEARRLAEQQGDKP